MSQVSRVGFGRAQRLILYAAASVWFMAFVLSRQRNYQDSWILADVVWPFVIWVGIFLWVLSQEDDNRVVAVLCAWTVALATIIPGLKYKQPYGNSIDGSLHYLVTMLLITTGRPLPSDLTYGSIPAMHSWLATVALTGGYSAQSAIKYTLSLTGGLIPLIVYWLSRRVGMPTGPARYSIALSALSTFTLFEPSGTGFTLVPLLLVMGALMLREYYVPAGPAQVGLSALVVLGVLQLVIWHSTTPMLLPFMLGLVSFTPVGVRLLSARAGRWRLSGSFLWLGVLMAVLFTAYHVLDTDEIFRVVATTARRFLLGRVAAQDLVPTRAFQISPLDFARVLLIAHGRDVLLLALAGLGALIVWRYRLPWRGLLQFYVFWALITGASFVMIVAAFTGLDYERFLVLPVTVSPFLAGTALWWLHRRLQPRSTILRWAGRLAWSALVLVLVAAWTVGFYSYQPLIPKAKSLSPGAPDEYVVWVHAVNTAYQQNMLTFAEDHTDPKDRFALDITGHRQFLRYFGLDAGNRRGLYLPLQLQEPVEPAVDYFLLHWPGVAGAMAEQVEWRSTQKITEIRNTPGYSLVYDNGQSFVLKVR